MSAAFEASVAPPYPHAFLRSVPMLADLDEAAIDALLAEMSWVRVRSANTVLKAGEDADAMYWVVSGRVAVLDEKDAVLTDFGSGFQFGEVGLLLGGARTASIWTLRDTELARLSRESFDKLTREQPILQLALARALAQRLSLNGIVELHTRLSTVAVVPLSAELRGFARELVDAYAPDEPPHLVTEAWLTEVVTSEVVQENMPKQSIDQRMAMALNHLEQDSRTVVLAADERPESWTQRCLRQADRVLLVVDGAATPSLGALTELMQRLAKVKIGATVELVLVHPESTELPSGTARWLALHPFSFHHHLRRGSRAHLRRLIRHLRGESVGVVLGGGGARAFAHAGALRRLHEAKIPVDRIGGASMGAVVAAWYAMHPEPERFQELADRFAKAKVQWELTIPFVSFLSINRAKRLYQLLFGDRHFEDLWLPAFALTVNLSHCDLQVHRAGPLKPLLMAGASPPGIWPPGVTAKGEIIVDGGVLDNMPVAIMRQIARGPVIGVDVSRDDPMLVPTYVKESPSPLRYLLSLLNPFKRGSLFPNIYRILLRTAAVTGTRREMQARDLADLYIEPSVGGFAIGDYHRLGALMKLGYEAADALIGTINLSAAGPHAARIPREDEGSTAPSPAADAR